MSPSLSSEARTGLRGSVFKAPYFKLKFLLGAPPVGCVWLVVGPGVLGLLAFTFSSSIYWGSLFSKVSVHSEQKKQTLNSFLYAELVLGTSGPVLSALQVQMSLLLLLLSGIEHLL